VTVGILCSGEEACQRGTAGFEHDQTKNVFIDAKG
jgi:hypothetical protein